VDHQEKAKQQYVREELVKQSKLIDKNRKKIIRLIFASILIPIALLLLNCWLTLEQNYGKWSARTGSIIVFFIITAEFLIFANKDLMKPPDRDKNGLTYRVIALHDELAKKYNVENNKWPFRILYVALIGTIIWGYGDFIWGFFSKIP
jgi:hypothetical protein